MKATRALVAAAVPAVAFAIAAIAPSARAQTNPHDWPMYQHDIARTGFNPNETKVNRDTAGLLHFKCVFHADNAITASPVVVNFDHFGPLGTEAARKVVYVGSADENFYAIDASDCSKIWEFKADSAPGIAYNMFVSSAFVDKPRGQLYVGGGFTMYALDLYTGAKKWGWSTANRGGGVIESSPVMVNDPASGRGMVYFGSDLDGAVSTVVPKYPAVHAVDADSGNLEWYWRPSTIGSCGDVWCSVAVDPDESLLYFATSDCGGGSQGLYNEAVIALPIQPSGSLSGDLRRLDLPSWYYQPRDIDPYDYDFGSTPLLFDLAGKKYLGIGGKDGFYYVIERQKGDPAGGFRDVTWKQRVVRGGYAGGFIGSTATDGATIFGATALLDVPPSPNPQAQPPYLHAFDAATGTKLWQQVLSGPTFAATTMVPGVVFVGSTDGIFMALDAESGQVLWLFPAIGAVSSGAAVSDGEVFVGAGTTAVSYMLGQGPINGLFAFALPANPPELPGPPELPPAMWPLGVLEYPLPDETTPAATPTPSS